LCSLYSCRDNIPHPKPNKYDTYEYRKFGTAHPSAPADTLADATDPTVARSPSSTTSTTAARDAQHDTVRTSARTTSAPMTATPSAHGRLAHHTGL